MGLFIKRDNLPPELEKVYVNFYWSQPKLWSLDLKVTEMQVSELEWIFDYPIWYKDSCQHPRELIIDLHADERHRMRIEEADLCYPIHVIHWKGRYLVLDGVHRLLKQKIGMKKTTPVKLLEQSHIEKILPDEEEFDSGFLKGLLEQRHKYMRKTFDLAQASMSCGNHPFGALLVLDDKIVEEAQNTVITDKDVTKHAELNLVSKLGRYSAEELGRSVLFTSTEPCAMCTGAIVWAGIRRVVYGCPAPKLKEIAQSPFMIEAKEIVARLDEEFILEGPLLMDAAVKLHEEYWP